MIEQIPVADLKVTGSVVELSESTKKSFRRIIRAQPQTPIVVTEDNEVIDGNYRVLAFKTADMESIPAIRITKEELDE